MPSRAEILESMHRRSLRRTRAVLGHRQERIVSRGRKAMRSTWIVTALKHIDVLDAKAAAQRSIRQLAASTACRGQQTTGGHEP